ncbi:MAG TPA: hypothetical protein VFZ21_26310 [Gemmatimonadaceae bacterium]|nr:hypothetical protein [Gemmatimonadaceae bacterium]
MAVRVRVSIGGVARVVGVVGATSAVLGCTSAIATPAEVDSYRRRAGTLVVRDTSPAAARGRYVSHRVRLSSSTGMTVDGRLFRPRAGSGCYPAVLLQNGREENSNVIGRLPADFGDVVVLSLDYPAAVPGTLRLRDVLLRGDQLRRAMGEIPASFLLGVAYLAHRHDVDTGRIALAATSFAVPFATIAAAADPRIREVALIYGAGNLPAVVAANLTTGPRWLRRPLAWLATRPFVTLAPERYIGRIAPRRIVFVNGVDDPQMPVDAVRHLFDAAREPKSMTWLQTGHLMPTDSALIRTLVDSAFAQLAVLHAPAQPGRCARRE